MAHCFVADIRFRDLPHFDRRLYPYDHIMLLERIRKSKRIHHSSKHTDMIGPRSVHFFILRAVEINADAILLAKNVDAVYDKDPMKYEDARKYCHLTHYDVLQKDLKVMDSTAASMCKDNSVRIHVFGVKDPYNMVRAVCGEDIGTVIE